MKIFFICLFVLNAVLCPGLEMGYASWYGGKFHGRLTANGEVYDMNKLSAAHKTLPFGTSVRVINIENGKSIVVKINDRGPFVEGRIIDLSRAAAEKIDMLKTGIARVIVEVVSHSHPRNFLYYVQIGSYAQPENARDVEELFKETEWTVAVEVTDRGFHRVIIRDVYFETLPALMKELSDLGIHQVLITKKKRKE
jgi:rare lipoprotein A